MDEVGSIVEPTSSLTWADVIRADFQRVISRYIQNISTCLFRKATRGLRTISIQKSKPKYAYLPSEIVAVRIDRFCVRYDCCSRCRQCPQCDTGSTNFLAWRQRIISLACFANNVIHPWPQMMPTFDREMPLGFTPAICLCWNFESPIWRTREANLSTKTSKILFWTVMLTFGKIVIGLDSTASKTKAKFDS